MIYAVMFLWFGFWSSQAGRSMRSISPKLNDWQDKFKGLSSLPELIIALTIATIAATGWQTVFDLGFWATVGVFVVSTAIAYAGKQSATWAYLNWEGHKNPDTDRSGKTRPFNDWLAGLFGKKLGDEGYSWVWAFTKGLITTLPIGGLGAIFQPLWREVASHAKGRLPYDPNMWMEIGDGFAYATAAVIFIMVVF